MPTTADYRDWSGQSFGWRYLAQRIDGTGVPGTFLANELPLHGVSLTDVLSGPPQLKGTIAPAFKSMKGSDGQPLLGEWGTLIHAEKDGVIQGSTILVGSGFKGSDWSLDCSGFTTIMQGMSYPGTVGFTQTDPLDVVRHFWDVIQMTEDSNLGLQIDRKAHSNRIVGSLVAAPSTAGVSSTGEVTAVNLGIPLGPLGYTWWQTFDLNAEIDKLAKATPFDYHERHEWDPTHSFVNHYLDLGYPTLGARRDNLRFVYGENIQLPPDVARDGSTFSNHVLVLGAGQGSLRIRGEARVRDGRIRRMNVVDDATITTQAEATYAARLEMAKRFQLTQVTTFSIRNTGLAPLGSFGVGDEIRFQAETEWITVDLWCRVVSLTVNPETPDMMTVSVIRSDWLVMASS